MRDETVGRKRETCLTMKTTVWTTKMDLKTSGVAAQMRGAAAI